MSYEKKWVSPEDIYVHTVLNNRDINQNYVSDISESMTDKGFLPEFPIDVFLTKNLANIDTDLPFTCACGAHRTLAAINAKLDRVLVHIHKGREEDFIEMMHLDNFQFDPAINSGIGQPFTQKEKRAAVTQLLLLPKFFEQTNAALVEMWRIPDTSIRRWRGEVIQLLETDSPKLRLWGISDGRLARLRELAAKPERVNAEGKIVNIRKPMTEATEDEKKAFFDQMEEDFSLLEEKHDFEWNNCCTYLKQLWDTEDGKWYIYREVSLKQMQNVHHLILSENIEFIAAVQKIADVENRVRAERDRLSEASEQLIETFKKIFAPKEDKYSKAYKDTLKRFQAFIRKHDPEKYGKLEVEYYNYDFKDRDDPDFCEIHAGLHHAIITDLTSEAEWLEAFRAKETARMGKLRENVMARWVKHHKMACEALVQYPRKIAPDTLLSYADRQLDHGSGKLPKLIETEAPSTNKFTDTLDRESELFKQLAHALNNNVEWVKEIPEPKPLISVLVDAEDSPKSPLTELELDEIFLHIQSRVDFTQTHPDDEMLQMKGELLRLIGTMSRGILESQIYIVADIGLWLTQIRDGEEIPR